MANICLYKIKVKGKKNNCLKFEDIMPMCDWDFQILESKGTDDDYTFSFITACKWGVDYRTQKTKGKLNPLTDEEVEYLKEMLEAELENSDVTFDGFYADEDLKAEFDFTKAFDQDATVYLKLSKVQQKVNPGTSDINLIFILGTLLIGGAGLGFTLKNRKFN